MDASDDRPAVGLLPPIGAAILACAVLTPLGVFLLDLNWTQALLFGGFSAVIAAFAATRSARRTATS